MSCSHFYWARYPLPEGLLRRYKTSVCCLSFLSPAILQSLLPQQGLLTLCCPCCAQRLPQRRCKLVMLCWSHWALAPCPSLQLAGTFGTTPICCVMGAWQKELPTVSISCHCKHISFSTPWKDRLHSTAQRIASQCLYCQPWLSSVHFLPQPIPSTRAPTSCSSSDLSCWVLFLDIFFFVILRVSVCLLFPRLSKLRL